MRSTVSHELMLLSCENYSSIGARYLRRGVDEDGYVGNFVETEMVSSMLKIRKKCSMDCMCVCVFILHAQAHVQQGGLLFTDAFPVVTTFSIVNGHYCYCH